MMHELTGFYHFMFQPSGAPWYSGAFWSNQTQWTVVWLPSLIVIYKHKFKCATCWRPAHHQVQGTHLKTCHKHTNAVDHAKIKKQHAKDYPEEHKFLNKEK